MNNSTLEELRKDPVAFVEQYYQTKDANGVVKPFALTPAQKEILRLMASDEPVVIRLSRQNGRAWLNNAITEAVRKYEEENDVTQDCS